MAAAAAHNAAGGWGHTRMTEHRVATTTQRKPHARKRAAGALHPLQPAQLSRGNGAAPRLWLGKSMRQHSVSHSSPHTRNNISCVGATTTRNNR